MARLHDPAGLLIAGLALAVAGAWLASAGSGTAGSGTAGSGTGNSGTGSSGTGSSLLQESGLQASGLRASELRKSGPQDSRTSAESGSVDWTQAFGLAEELERDDPLGAAELILAELQAGPRALDGAQLELAFRLGNALVDGGELERAAALQIALHASARAEWSAINATLTLSQLGRQEQARALLEALVAEQPGLAGAWSHLGLMAWSAGDAAGARRGFGRAALLGSEDARSNLGRIELRAEHRERARAWFRSGVGLPQPGAWSLRGWGLTLLPAVAPANGGTRPEVGWAADAAER